MSVHKFVIADHEGEYHDGSANVEANEEGFMVINGSTLRIINQRTPASATAPGLSGEMCYDNSYIYVCIANDTWKRVEITTW